METTNLYRVNYVYRNKPPDYTIKNPTGNAAVQEKATYVAAKSPEEAVSHIHSLDKGNEVVSASAHLNNIQVAGVKPTPAPGAPVIVHGQLVPRGIPGPVKP